MDSMYKVFTKIKNRLFLFFLVMTSSWIIAQVPVGIKHDANGYPFDGYFDPLTYDPDEPLSKIDNVDYYEKGHYYDSSGNKKDGFVKITGNKIHYKDKRSAQKRIRLKLDVVQSIVIGIDSFFTVKNYLHKHLVQEKTVLVQHLTEYNGLQFAKNYNFTSNGTFETYFVRKLEGNELWVKFSKKKKFKEEALLYFSDVEEIKNKIGSKKQKEEDLFSIIKTTEYYHNYKNSEMIMYDQYWQEINDPANMQYHAKVINKVDSTWTLEYYKDSEKLYSAQYISFYPNKKNGDFIAYYPNGKKRKTILYADDKPLEVQTFYETGILKSHAKYIDIKNESTQKMNYTTYYRVFNDSLGKNLLNKNGIAIIKQHDPFTKNNYTSVFDKNELKSLYRIRDKDTIYQQVDRNNAFKISRIKTSFVRYTDLIKFKDAAQENAQGTILVSLLINDSGFVEEYTVLNKIHPQLDKLVDEFATSKLLAGATPRVKLKPYKKNREKKYLEVVIPIELGVNRFYRKPANYYFHDHFFWQQHQMMMQQQFNTVPRF